MDDRPVPMPLSPKKARRLRLAMAVGACMVVLPFLATAVTVTIASRVPDGLRGATHIPAMQDKVTRAYISVVSMAVFAPPGVLLFVMSALTLAGKNERRPDEPPVADPE